jgi:hypothetical protein
MTDKNREIPFNDPSLNPESDKSEEELRGYIAGSLVNRGTADYFSFLQTHFNQGATFKENAELIHQHLISTLPPDKGEELFNLYIKFVKFEYAAAEKAQEWRMPESADETLELISKMQKYQQEYFGEKTADLLFGQDMKMMEYNARRAGILNDRSVSGMDKEKLLSQLNHDMYGPDGDNIDKKKNPYNLFEEKLLVYKNDLDAMGPSEKEKRIRELREQYLPPEANVFQ